jgi:sortase A
MDTDEHFLYTNSLDQKEEMSIAKSKVTDLKKRIWKNTKLVLKMKVTRILLSLVGIFLAIYLLFNLPVYISRATWKQTTSTTIVQTTEYIQKPSADSATLDAGEVIPVESRISIPKIGVNAPIVYAESNEEKAIQDALQNGVVHYPGTALPGEVGNTFITGHSSNYWWAAGSYNYVFVLLDKLEVGDKAVVYYNSKKYVYTVSSKKVVEPTDTSVLLPTSTPTMTLMTCTPAGTSRQRLIISLDLTDPVYNKPEKVVKQKVIEVPATDNVSESHWWESLFSFFIPN